MRVRLPGEGGASFTEHAWSCKAIEDLKEAFLVHKEDKTLNVWVSY